MEDKIKQVNKNIKRILTQDEFENILKDENKFEDFMEALKNNEINIKDLKGKIEEVSI